MATGVATVTGMATAPATGMATVAGGRRHGPEPPRRRSRAG